MNLRLIAITAASLATLMVASCSNPVSTESIASETTLEAGVASINTSVAAGKSFSKTFRITNQTKLDYDLYLKAEPAFLIKKGKRITLFTMDFISPNKVKFPKERHTYYNSSKDDKFLDFTSKNRDDAMTMSGVVTNGTWKIQFKNNTTSALKLKLNISAR